MSHICVPDHAAVFILDQIRSLATVPFTSNGASADLSPERFLNYEALPGLLHVISACADDSTRQYAFCHVRGFIQCNQVDSSPEPQVSTTAHTRTHRLMTQHIS